MCNEELVVIEQLKKDYNLKIEDACFATEYIPKFILLDKSRNIHSYIVPCYIHNRQLSSSYWDNESFCNSVLQFVRIQYSQLDRPMFFVYTHNGDVKVIEGEVIKRFFEDHTPQESLMDFMITSSNHFKDILNIIKAEL